MATSKEARNRVLAGVEFLNEKRSGWQDELDHENMDISDGCMCILGELYGAFNIGCELLGLVNPDRNERFYPSRQYGFFDEPGVVDYSELQDAWAEIIDNGIPTWEDLQDRNGEEDDYDPDYDGSEDEDLDEDYEGELTDEQLNMGV